MKQSALDEYGVWTVGDDSDMEKTRQKFKTSANPVRYVQNVAIIFLHNENS